MNEIKKSQIEEHSYQQQKNFTPYFNKYEQANRISDSFPPTTNQNQHYYASGHKILDQIDKQKITQNDFIFKQIAQKEQINEIKMLHREWFPIQYPDNFFTQIFERQVNVILVEMKLEKFMNIKKYSENDENYNDNDDYFNNKLQIDFEYDREYELYVKKNKTIVVGMLIWNNRVTKSKYLNTGILDYFRDDYLAIYIMTIGVINELRQFGIATKLIERIKYEAKLSQNSHMKYIYLHMVTYNQSGKKFYEKNGFKVVGIKYQHYTIEGQERNAFVFMYYCNGGKPPKKLYDILKIGKIKEKFYSVFCQRKQITNLNSNNDQINNNQNENKQQVQRINQKIQEDEQTQIKDYEVQDQQKNFLNYEFQNKLQIEDQQ